MSEKVDVERAFKDEAYLKTLTAKQLACVKWDPSDQQMYIEATLDKMFHHVAEPRLKCQTTTGSCLATKRMGC